jgi:hypothetical protein
MPSTELQESTGVDLPPRPGDVMSIPMETDLAATGVDLPQRPLTDEEFYPIEAENDGPAATGVDLPLRPPPGGNVQIIPIEADELPDDERETETYQQQHLLEGEADLGDLDAGVDLDEETEQMDHPPWMDSGELTSPDLPRRIPGPKIDTGYFKEDERPRPPSAPAPRSRKQQEVELPPPPPVPPAPPLPPDPQRVPRTLPWGSEELKSDAVEDDGLATLPTVTEEPPLPPRMSRRTSERMKVLDRAISEVIEGDGVDGPTGNYTPDVAPLPPMPPLPPSAGRAIVPPPPAMDDQLRQPPQGREPPPGGAIVPPPPPADPFPSSGGAIVPPLPGPAPQRRALGPPPPGGGVGPLGDDLEPETIPAVQGVDEARELGPIHLGDTGITVVVPNTPIHEVRSSGSDAPEQEQPPQVLVPAAAGVASNLNELAPISRPPPRSVPGHGTARKAEAKAPPPTWLIYTLIAVTAFAVLMVVGIVLAVRFLGD